MVGPVKGPYPTLWDFVSLEEWEPGVPRKTGSVLLCNSEGRLRLWLHDNDQRRSAWVSGLSLAEVLAAAEEGLDGDCLEWRKEKPKPGGR